MLSLFLHPHTQGIRARFFPRPSKSCKQESRKLNKSMTTGQKLRKLINLERQAQKLRDDLKISQANEVLFRAPEGTWSDNYILVQAGGLGDATLLIVEGNYPIDY